MKGQGQRNQEGQDVKNYNAVNKSAWWNVKEDEIGIVVLSFNREEVYIVYRLD